MASGYHGVIAGEKPPAATINDFWSKQANMVYTSAAVRSADAGLTAVLREGMISYLLDVNSLQLYDGAAWVTIANQQAWTAVTFANSWVDFGAPYNVCQYRKIGDITYLRGLMKSGTVGATCFTLPAGFRPPVDLYFITVSNSVAAPFIVASSGACQLATGSNVFASINLQFSTT